MSSRAAPTHYLGNGRLDRAARHALPAVSPDVAMALCVSTVLALALAAFGPPGRRPCRPPAPDLRRSPADGWRFWDNYWYAGRYELINYSPLYYPLAALVGVPDGGGRRRSSRARGCSRRRCCGSGGARARLSALLFAAFWPGVLVAGQYPFALGCAVRARGARRAAARPPVLLVLCCLASLLASPLAFLLLGVTLVGLTARTARRPGAAPHARARPGLRDRAARRSRSCSSSARSPPAARSPTRGSTSSGITGFARVRGAARPRRRARPPARRASSSPTSCSAGPPSCTRRRSAATRTRLLDYVALPLLALVAALRGFRPRLLVALALGVAVAWQSVPHRQERGRRLHRPGAGGDVLDAGARLPAADRTSARRTTASRSSRPGGTRRRTTCRRAASRSPAAGTARTPTARRTCRAYRGGPVTPALYRDWLRAMGVRYVLLPRDELDPAARAEAAAAAAGRARARAAPSSSPHLAIYELRDAVADPDAAARVRRPARAARTRILRMTGDSISRVRAGRGRLQSESELHALLAGRRPDGGLRRAGSRGHVPAARDAPGPGPAARLRVARGRGHRPSRTGLRLAPDAASQLTAMRVIRRSCATCAVVLLVLAPSLQAATPATTATRELVDLGVRPASVSVAADGAGVRRGLRRSPDRQRAALRRAGRRALDHDHRRDDARRTPGRSRAHARDLADRHPPDRLPQRRVARPDQASQRRAVRRPLEPRRARGRSTRSTPTAFGESVAFDRDGPAGDRVPGADRRRRSGRGAARPADRRALADRAPRDDDVPRGARRLQRVLGRPRVRSVRDDRSSRSSTPARTRSG